MAHSVIRRAGSRKTASRYAIVSTAHFPHRARDMEPASAHAGAPAPHPFTDGLGVRRRTAGAHGANAGERIVVTPNARIMMVEHVLGAALSELQYTRERYWKELRVALPGATGAVAFSHRSDVAQLGVVALSLIIGRPLA